LRQFYLDYLAAINAKNWAQVSSFAQASVVHNGRSMSGVEYATMIDETSGVFPGIFFVPEMLLCDDEKGEIACRIRFDFENGRKSFFEHVFYQLEGGKIARVWSMINDPEQ
jgi:predicted ester cyclase